MAKPSVLIIEDDKFVLKAMQYKFEEKNFKVRTSNSAEKGLETLENLRPDVIVLDIFLPGIDGFAFLRKTRSHPLWKNIPIIVASNLPEDSFREPGDKTEYVEYIVKSDLDLDKLVGKVKAITN